MSKVKITGNASGTGVFTIEAPGTNNPRTITLPDSTGTILDENSSLPAANLTGTIADARLPDPLPAIDGSSLTGITANDNTPRFVAYAGSVYQSLTSGTWTKAVWQGGVGMIDTDSAYDLVNHKFVVPSGEAGDYYFQAQTSFYSDANDLRYPNIAIYKNGTAMAWGFQGGFNSAQDWRHGSVRIATVETLAVADYIEMYVNATVGSGNIHVNTSSNNKFHYIMGWKLA